jgi:3-oxoacyl-[acyl-carrier-protein] synthase-3
MHKKERVQMWPLYQKALLAKRGTTFAQEEFDYIIQHQVGTRAIANFSRVGGAIFESEMPESLSVVEELGNTATTSHFLVLYQHLKEKKLKKGSKLLMVPAASGLVTGCLSTTITALVA